VQQLGGVSAALDKCNTMVETFVEKTARTSLRSAGQNFPATNSLDSISTLEPATIHSFGVFRILELAELTLPCYKSHHKPSEEKLRRIFWRLPT
jgi:hypothetical protein